MHNPELTKRSFRRKPDRVDFFANLTLVQPSPHMNLPKAFALRVAFSICLLTGPKQSEVHRAGHSVPAQLQAFCHLYNRGNVIPFIYFS